MCLRETCRRVRVGRFVSDGFAIHCGLKQGDALSPLLSNFALEQWWPTCGTCATCGMHMLSKCHTQSHFSSQSLALGDMALRYYCRFGSTYICEKKTVSIMNLVKTMNRSILTDHLLKNLLVLATSSVNPNIE